MPIMAKSNDEYAEVKAIKTPDGTEIDYVLSKVDNTYKRTYTAIRELEDAPPLEFKSIKPNANLIDYRIYGQTVDGESVGDRTGNLFEAEIVQGGLNGATGAEFDSDNRCRSSYILLDAGTYTISISSSHTIGLFIFSSTNVFETFVSYSDSPITFSLETVKKVRFGFSTRYGDGSITPSDISNIMLNSGSTPLPYEPYGYKVPMTVEGKNLFDTEIVQGSFNNSTGAPTVVPDRIRSNGNAFIFLNSGIYTINANGAHDVVVYCYSSNDVSTFVKSASEVSWQNLPYKFTANAAYYYLFAFRNATNSTITTSDVSNIMLNTGSNPLPYEPYRTPITTPIYLPEQIKKVGDEAEYIDYGEQKQHRVRKNLLPNTATSRTVNGVTFTVNSDGSITCSGTATATAFFKWMVAGILPNNKRVFLTGCPSGGGASNYLLKMQIVGSPDALITDTGHGSIALFSQPIYPVLRIQAGYTCNNLTFYPMLRLASITDDTYEPYIENTDLDVTLPALPTVTGTNVLSVGTEVQPSDMYIKGNFKMIAGGGE